MNSMDISRLSRNHLNNFTSTYNGNNNNNTHILFLILNHRTQLR